MMARASATWLRCGEDRHSRLLHLYDIGHGKLLSRHAGGDEHPLPVRQGLPGYAPGCTPRCSSTLRPRSGTLIPGGPLPEQHQGQGCTRAPGWMITRRCSASGPGSSLLWRWRKKRSRRVSRIEVALRCSSRGLSALDRSIESFLAIEIPHFQARAKQGI